MRRDVRVARRGEDTKRMRFMSVAGFWRLNDGELRGKFQRRSQSVGSPLDLTPENGCLCRLRLLRRVLACRVLCMLAVVFPWWAVGR